MGSSSPLAGQNSIRRPLTVNGSLRLLQATPSRSSSTSESSREQLLSRHCVLFCFFLPQSKCRFDPLICTVYPLPEDPQIYLQFIHTPTCVCNAYGGGDDLSRGTEEMGEAGDFSSCMRERETNSHRIKRYISVSLRLILASPSHPRSCPDSTPRKMNTT